MSHVMRKPHPRSLISAFVVRCLDSIISILAKSKVSRLQLASVAVQAGLSHIWSQTTEDRFSRDEAQHFVNQNSFPFVFQKAGDATVKHLLHYI